jgi:hypothetical protein
MRKRLLVPRWWLEGVFCLSFKGANTGILESFLAQRGGCDFGVRASALLSPRSFVAMAIFWNGICRRILDCADESLLVSPHPEVSLSKKDLFGSSAINKAHMLAEFSHAAMAPMEEHRIARNPGGQAGTRISIQATGSTTALVRSVSLSENADSINVTFLRPLQQVMLGEAQGANGVGARDICPSVVSLAPSVLKWHGEKTSLRRFALYLYFELTKHKQLDVQHVATKGTPLLEVLGAGPTGDFFQELMGRASGLYDHGILGWCDTFPTERIRALGAPLQSGVAPAGAAAAVSLGGPRFVQIVQRSAHLSEVASFEARVARHLDPAQECSIPKVAQQPPVQANGSVRRVGVLARLASARGATKSNSSVNGRNNSSSGRAAATGLAFPSAVGEPKPALDHPPAPSQGYNLKGAHNPRLPLAARPAVSPRRPVASVIGGGDGEMEYVLKLAQYYESLSPAQRRDLDREMQYRTPADFKDWLRPILERTH